MVPRRSVRTTRPVTTGEMAAKECRPPLPDWRADREFGSRETGCAPEVVVRLYPTGADNGPDNVR